MPGKTTEAGTRPRVLLSGPVPPPVGGIAAFCQALLESSLPERVEMRFVRTSPAGRALLRSGRLCAGNLISAAADCGRFAAAAARFRPQVAHIATAFGLSFVKHSVCVLAARLVGSRVLLHPHCSVAALYSDRPRWWRWFFRRIAGLSDGIVALSSEWAQIGLVVPGCPVYYLPNAMNLAPYQAIARQRLERGKTGPFRVLYLGYLGRAKGTFDLLAAARLVCSGGLDVAFELVGDELAQGDRRRLDAEFKRAGLTGCVRLCPAASGAEKEAFFARADAFVYPSYHEGMPMAVIEAMACALPVVATRVGGLPDLVADGVNGVLVEPACPEQLAHALRTLAIDQQLCDSMGRAGRRMAAEQYDIEQCVAQLVGIYQATLDRGQGRRTAQAKGGGGEATSAASR